MKEKKEKEKDEKIALEEAILLSSNERAPTEESLEKNNKKEKDTNEKNRGMEEKQDVEEEEKKNQKARADLDGTQQKTKNGSEKATWGQARWGRAFKEKKEKTAKAAAKLLA